MKNLLVLPPGIDPAHRTVDLSELSTKDVAAMAMVLASECYSRGTTGTSSSSPSIDGFRDSVRALPEGTFQAVFEALPFAEECLEVVREEYRRRSTEASFRLS